MASQDGLTATNITSFNGTIEMLTQQKVSHFLNAVVQGSHEGDTASYVDQLDAFDLNEKTTKLAPHELEEYQMYRRWVSPTDYRKAIGCDWGDLLRVMNDPQSKLAENSVAAYNRRADDVIISALLGNSGRGQKSATEQVALPSSQEIAHGSAGMSFSKIADAMELMLDNHLDPSMNDLYLALAPRHLKELLLETDSYDGEEVKTIRSIQAGQVAELFGFKCFVSTQLETTTAAANKGEIPAIAFEANACHFGIWKPLSVRVDERTDLDMASQVYVSASFGAARTEEARVVKINNDGAA